MTLSELRKIAEAATSGPWECVNGYGEKTDFNERIFHVTAIDSGLETVMCGFDYEIEGSKQNFKYITTFNPQTILALLDEIELVRAFDHIEDIQDYDALIAKIDTARARVDEILKGV